VVAWTGGRKAHFTRKDSADTLNRREPLAVCLGGDDGPSPPFTTRYDWGVFGFHPEDG
jgi:hypothetical protein